jgi:carboxymethylenebutenolidase
LNVQTQDVMVPVGGHSMPSYLARPDGDRPRPAVIVLQEIFGVNREVRRIAELVAGAGYVALAINYYHRTHPSLNEPYTPDGFKQGFAAASAVRRENVLADLGASIAWLDAQPFVERGKIATLGFCFGGTLAFLSATLPGIRAAISFYGGMITESFPSGEPGPLADVAAVHVPLLLFFGGKDEHITPDKVARIDAGLASHHKTYEIVTYPDSGHGFFRESSAKLNDADVADAWTRVQAFLASTLK